MFFVDTTVRNLDDDAYRALKARAALEGKTVGEAMSDAIRLYLSAPARKRKRSILDAAPIDFGPGTERLSERIDEIVYGI